MNTLSQHSASAGHGKGYSFLVAIGASIGGLLYGYDTGIIASALLFLREDFAITDNAFMQSVVTSATLLGAIFGALVAGLGIAIFSQATGISAIIYYAPSLLVMAQFGKSAAILGSVGIGVVLTAFTLLGIWLLDVLGRRRLMLIGLPGAVIVLVVMSLLLPWSANAQEILSDTNKVVVLTCLLGYFAFNGGSLSVVTWLYCAEIFPLGVRGKGTALCSFTLWTVNFIVTLLLYFSADALGIGLVFGVLAIVNALAWFFVWGYAPETRGRSLEDIEQSLINGQFNPRQALSLHKINSD